MKEEAKRLIEEITTVPAFKPENPTGTGLMPYAGPVAETIVGLAERLRKVEEEQKGLMDRVAQILFDQRKAGPVVLNVDGSNRVHLTVEDLERLRAVLR